MSYIGDSMDNVVLKRVITGYGKSRTDIGGKCPERFDFDFLRFV